MLAAMFMPGGAAASTNVGWGTGFLFTSVDKGFKNHSVGEQKRSNARRPVSMGMLISAALSVWSIFGKFLCPTVMAIQISLNWDNGVVVVISEKNN
jgi:hypothetical protein